MPRRNDGRQADQLRSLTILTEFTKHAEGSVLITCGDTKVICTASVEDRVPQFLRGTGKGWVTSEYGMIPRSTNTRMIREASKGKPSGRTQEIQRLIGRSLRSVVDLPALGERTVWLDCDVIQADGGTRTASITGAFVALALAVDRLQRQQLVMQPLLLDFVAAVSVGVVDQIPLLDLNYEEDAAAEVDMNVVMTGRELFVEVQGTAEGKPFSPAVLDRLLDLARSGIRGLIGEQQRVLKESVEDCVRLFVKDPQEELATPAGQPKSG